MGFGAELTLFFALGFVVLGPKRMQKMLGHVARAKTEFDKASRSIKSRLATELQRALPSTRTNDDETVAPTR
jgi:Sec-independent protein translocase protein TatA